MKQADRKNGFTLYLGELRTAVEAFQARWEKEHLVKPTLGEATLILVRAGLNHYHDGNEVK